MGHFNLCFWIFRSAYHGVSPSTLGLTNVGQYKFSYPHGFGTHAVSKKTLILYLLISSDFSLFCL